MYPAPAAVMMQHLLTLPALADEQDYMLEVQIGQKIVDCNKTQLIGEINTLLLADWGYTYYQVDKVIQGPTNRIMCTEANNSPIYCPQ
jgi:ecotin